MSQPSLLSHTQKKFLILKNLKYLWRFQFAPIIHDFCKCSASSELYSIYIFFSSSSWTSLILSISVLSRTSKKCLTFQSGGGFFSHSSLQHEKQVKPSYFRGIPKRIIHYLQRTSTAAMSQNIPSSEGVRTPTNLSKNHLLSGQIEAFPMHNLFHKHLLS